MNREEIIRKYWAGIPADHVIMTSGEGLGDIIRKIWEIHRITEFGIPCIDFYYTRENMLNFFESYIKLHFNNVNTYIGRDFHDNIAPWHPIGLPMRIRKNFSFKKVLLHRKTIDNKTIFTQKNHNWSHRVMSPLMFNDIGNELEMYFSEIESIDLPYKDNKCFLFDNFLNASKYLEDVSFVFGEISSIHMMASCFDIPFYSPVQRDGTCTLIYPCNIIYNIFSRTVVLENEEEISFYNLYNKNRKYYVSILRNILRDQLDKLSSFEPDIRMSFDIPNYARDIISEHVSNNIFKKLSVMDKNDENSPSTFVFVASSISDGDINFLIGNIVLYIDLIDYINELCKKYRIIRCHDGGRIGGMSYDLYIRSNLKDSSGRYTYPIMNSDSISFQCESVLEVR